MIRVSNKSAKKGIKRPLQDNESEEDEVSYQRHKKAPSARAQEANV